MAEDQHYGFGENWADFVDRAFSNERVEIAQTHLLHFLGVQSLDGMSFLDIGCGSGIHSLAAWRAGAERVHSFDYDQDSVETTHKLRTLAGSPANWVVEQGSVLDYDYMEGLPKADVVYSWGVLHHTGQMWEAVRNATLPMDEQAVLYIALYCSDVYVKPPPQYWIRVKQRYNRSGPVGRRMMEYQYMARRLAPMLLRGKNPVRYVREYRQMRGMDYRTDVRDWLGGWPMEFASLAETKAFCRKELGLELINVLAGGGCAEYLFRKEGARNYWDEYFASLPAPKRLSGPFEHVAGHCYRAALVARTEGGTPPGVDQRSELMLYEDGAPVGFVHAPPHHIERYGMGRYCRRNGSLLFSTTDNSDPRTNGRQYSYREIPKPPAATR
jgi:SAM-dependent methyltransferase